MPGRALFSALFLIFNAYATFASPAIADPSAPRNSCPLTLVAVSLGGESVSGREAMYRVDATVVGPVTSAKILLRQVHGASVVSWPKIDTVDTPTARKASFWFTHPSADSITAASVSSVVVDGTRRDCLPADARLADAEGRITVYDDSHPHIDLVDAQVHHDAISEITDSSFSKKLYPDYPVKAQVQNIQGDVTVGIQIGPDGVPQYAWVVSHNTSDMSDQLDEAALGSALHSLYVPFLEDGVAIAKRYRIIYNFRLDGPGEWPPKKPADDHASCPLLLDAIRVKNEDAQDKNAWCSLDVDALDASPSSAVIGTVDMTGQSTGVSWSKVLLQPSSEDDNLWHASATFNWSGSPIKSAWIDQVTMSNGKSYSCQPVVDVPDRLLQATAYPRTMIGSPLPLIPPQSLLPATFTNTIWPKYPASSDGVRASGHSTVEVIVDDRGRTREAFVTESSGHQELDLAAVDAATTSTYVPAPPSGVTLYEATYRFVP